MKRALQLLALAALALPLSGCIPSMVMKSQDRQHWSDYKLEMERVNMEREKAGLPPKPVENFDQWRGKKP